MSTNYRNVANSSEQLPRQRLFRLVELPQPPKDFTLLDCNALQALQPREPYAGVSLIVQAEWSWSPMHNRISSWEIGLDEAKQHWVLWCSYRTDDCEPAEWCDPDEDEEEIEWVAIWYSEVVAACPKGDLSERDASALLLLQAWSDERGGDMELDRPHFYTATGVLDINVIRSIESKVWK